MHCMLQLVDAPQGRIQSPKRGAASAAILHLSKWALQPQYAETSPHFQGYENLWLCGVFHQTTLLPTHRDTYLAQY